MQPGTSAAMMAALMLVATVGCSSAAGTDANPDAVADAGTTPQADGSTAEPTDASDTFDDGGTGSGDGGNNGGSDAGSDAGIDGGENVGDSGLPPEVTGICENDEKVPTSFQLSALGSGSGVLGDTTSAEFGPDNAIALMNSASLNRFAISDDGVNFQVFKNSAIYDPVTGRAYRAERNGTQVIIQRRDYHGCFGNAATIDVGPESPNFVNLAGIGPQGRLLLIVTFGIYARNELWIGSNYGTQWVKKAHVPAYYTPGIRGAMAPSDPNRIYLVNGYLGAKLYRSSDGGATWAAEVGIGPGEYSNPWIGEPTIHPTNPDIVVLVRKGTLYKSTDGGATWNTVAVPGTGATVRVARFDGGGRLWVAFSGVSGSGLFRSDDLTTMTPAEGGLAADNRGGIALGVSGSGSTTRLLVASPGGQPFVSADAGATWTSPFKGLGGMRLQATATHPSDANIFYAIAGRYDPYSGGAGDPGVVMKTTDGGATFSPTTAPRARHVFVLGNGDVITAGQTTGVGDSTVLNGYSDDQGATFHPLNLDLHFGCGANCILTGNTLAYYVTYYGKLMKSADSGANWTEIYTVDTNLTGHGTLRTRQPVVLDPTDENHLLVWVIKSYDGTQQRYVEAVFESKDAGATFTELTLPVLLDKEEAVFDFDRAGRLWITGFLQANPSDSRTPKIYTYFNGAFQEQTPPGVDPQQYRVEAVGNMVRVFSQFTTDGGATWKSLLTQSPDTVFVSDHHGFAHRANADLWFIESYHMGIWYTKTIAF